MWIAGYTEHYSVWIAGYTDWIDWWIVRTSALIAKIAGYTGYFVGMIEYSSKNDKTAFDKKKYLQDENYRSTGNYIL